MRKLRTVKDAQLGGKKIFVRVDFNVPVADGNVADDRKIRKTLPTLKHLLDQGAASLTLATHFSDFSTPIEPVREHFNQLLDDSRIAIRDNLRLNSGEEANASGFAMVLASSHDLYVNDAFAVCHRTHASVVAITKLLPAYAGLLVEKEVENLFHLLENPQRPFVVLIGGKKIEDKIGVIKRLSQIADTILVGGKTGLELATRNSSIKQLKNVQLLIDDIDGLDIGPKTVELFKQELTRAKTVFWNGNMGKSEDPRYAAGTHKIAKFIVSLAAKTYVGGGDTVAAVDELGLTDQFTFISTGGGATLEFLACNGELPGLKPLYES